MNNIDDINNPIYKSVYDELISEKQDEYFNSYEDFLLFCKKDFSKESKKTGLRQLVLLPQIELQKNIIEKLQTKTLSCKFDKITYFKYVYIKHSN